MKLSACADLAACLAVQGGRLGCALPLYGSARGALYKKTSVICVKIPLSGENS